MSAVASLQDHYRHRIYVVLELHALSVFCHARHGGQGVAQFGNPHPLGEAKGPFLHSHSFRGTTRKPQHSERLRAEAHVHTRCTRRLGAALLAMSDSDDRVKVCRKRQRRSEDFSRARRSLWRSRHPPETTRRRRGSRSNPPESNTSSDCGLPSNLGLSSVESNPPLGIGWRVWGFHRSNHHLLRPHAVRNRVGRGQIARLCEECWHGCESLSQQEL